MAKSKLARYRKRKKNAPASVANPGPIATQAYSIGAGFAGYVGTRFLARIVHQQAKARAPKFGKHAAAISSVLGAVGAYFLSQKWKRIEDYHESIVVGSAIAALQTILQTYGPAKYSWLLCDFHEEEASEAVKPKTAPGRPTASALPRKASLPTIEEEVDASMGLDLDQLLAENPDIEAVPVDLSAMDMGPAGEESSPEFDLGDFAESHEDRRETNLQSWMN